MFQIPPVVDLREQNPFGPLIDALIAKEQLALDKERLALDVKKQDLVDRQTQQAMAILQAGQEAGPEALRALARAAQLQGGGATNIIAGALGVEPQQAAGGAGGPFGMGLPSGVGVSEGQVGLSAIDTAIGQLDPGEAAAIAQNIKPLLDSLFNQDVTEAELGLKEREVDIKQLLADTNLLDTENNARIAQIRLGLEADLNDIRRNQSQIDATRMGLDFVSGVMDSQVKPLIELAVAKGLSIPEATRWAQRVVFGEANVNPQALAGRISQAALTSDPAALAATMASIAGRATSLDRILLDEFRVNPAVASRVSDLADQAGQRAELLRGSLPDDEIDALVNELILSEMVKDIAEANRPEDAVLTQYGWDGKRNREEFWDEYKADQIQRSIGALQVTARDGTLGQDVLDALEPPEKQESFFKRLLNSFFDVRRAAPIGAEAQRLRDESRVPTLAQRVQSTTQGRADELQGAMQEALRNSNAALADSLLGHGETMEAIADSLAIPELPPLNIIVGPDGVPVTAPQRGGLFGLRFRP